MAGDIDRRRWLEGSLLGVVGGVGLLRPGAGTAGPKADSPADKTHRGSPAAFGIHVVDEQTGRGVPLVELRTTNSVRFYTDSAGYTAVEDPGLMGQKVYFFVSSPGYEYPKDGFGYAGVALDVRPGNTTTVRIHRTNIAQRLYRATGEGTYRDSVILGRKTPIRQPLLNGKVTGQDSVLATVYRGRIYWIWGDTGRLAYPLGNFRSSGAMSDLPSHGGLPPEVGINYNYFTDKSGFCRAMCPLASEPGGVVWLGGLTVIPGPKGAELMVAHYSRRASLTKMLEHGLALWDDKMQIFRKYSVYAYHETWRMLGGHPAVYVEAGKEYRLFAAPSTHFPTVRVPATLSAIVDSSRYEAFTCLAPGTRYAKWQSQVERTSNGAPIWGWKRDTDPINELQERELISAGLIKPSEAHFQIVDADTRKPLDWAGGSFYWNDYLHKWIMIGGQFGGTSLLGEIWFSCADQPTGPWRHARKIATHPDYSFYNPTQLPFFDQQGGRIIYFQGTYSNTFSGNSHPTPRYDYNELMYRLDLSDARLRHL